MSRTVSLGDRGRVPFALVGVLLLVSSATFVATYSAPTPTPRPAVDVAIDRTSADARTALRDAAADAAVAAAAQPAISPADTPTGGVLRESRAFRDALALRIYVAARERFASLDRTHRGVEANVSLPATPDADALERARDRVTVEKAVANGTRLRVTVENVTVTAARGRRIVGERTETLTVVVDTAVLALHDRVGEYGEKLNGGLHRPGFDRRLTARLYAVAWARGYGQYGGLGIENVVGNRHVELMSNGALLGVQRSVFGRSDPDGRKALVSATTRVGLQDLLAATDATNESVVEPIDDRLRDATASANDESVPRLADDDVSTADVAGEAVSRVTNGSVPDPAGRTIEVEVGRSADLAFGSFLDREAINGTIDSVYEASARPVVARQRVERADPQLPDPPGDSGWERAANDTDTEVARVRSVDGAVPDVDLRPGAHRLRTVDRTVVVRHTRRSEWRHAEDGRVRTTSATDLARWRVRIVLAGTHAETPHAPDEPIRRIHEPAGRIAGSNLADIARAVNQSFVADRGGPDGLAADAVTGNTDGDPETFDGAWRIDLRRAIYDDLVSVRESVRNESVEVPAGQLGTFEATPANRLAERVRERRSALLASVDGYETAAEKARTAAKARYLSAVVENLESRSAARSRTESAFGDRLSAGDVGSLSLLRRAYDNRERARGADGPDEVAMHVDAAPAYLTVSSVDHEQTAAVEAGDPVHPMVARNVNVASIPYATVAETVLGFLLEGNRTRTTTLGTAANALSAANRTLERSDDDSLRTEQRKLQSHVERKIRGNRDRFDALLERRGIEPGVRERILDDAFAEWDSTHATAQALANGSMAGTLAAAAGRHVADLSDRDRDALLQSARWALAGPADDDLTEIRGQIVNETASEVSEAASQRLREAIDGGRIAEAVPSSALPAGVPIVPGYWTATANAWFVEVEGRYERFAVETPHRSATTGSVSLSYVRDGSNATLDVDDDGDEELLGTADRVSFSAQTAVVVVVPAGGSGVGDVDGETDERSPGWPDPGPVEDANGTSDRTTTDAANRLADPLDRRGPGREHRRRLAAGSR